MRPSFWKLLVSLVIDVLGIFPFFFGWGDLLYAPLQAIWIKYAYDSNVAAGIGFVEEILPLTDIFPTSTLTDLYFRFKKN